MNITISHTDLITRLSDRLAAAKIEDQRVASEHKKDEERALQSFREKLKMALSWDYRKAKNASRIYFEAPHCPLLQAPEILRILTGVQMDTRKQPFKVSDQSDIYRALMWLPASKRQPLTVCD